MPEGYIRILNWNIGGAKFLELKSQQSPNLKPGEKTREAFRNELKAAMNFLISHAEKPDVIALQEVVRCAENGDLTHTQNVLDCPDNYDYFPCELINTIGHSHQGKWLKVRKAGEWGKKAFFSQGNALLIKKDSDFMSYFPIWSLPKVNQNSEEWRPKKKVQRRLGDGKGCIEIVKLESGLYFGDRDTEPRAALVTHIVCSKLRQEDERFVPITKPQDIFVTNLHLTTLMMEREGVPQVDEEAAHIRMRQLEIVLDGVISRYNKWKKEGFRVRRERIRLGLKSTNERHTPIWIITGDFNFTPESMEYQTLLRRGFIDMMPLFPPTQTTMARHRPTKSKGIDQEPTITLDYVFAGPRFEAIDPEDAARAIQHNYVYTRPIVKVSDHYPLIADIPIVVNEP